MTNATEAQLSRILLVGGRHRVGAGQEATVIRRYRLARLHVHGQPSDAGRHSQLRRSRD